MSQTLTPPLPQQRKQTATSTAASSGLTWAFHSPPGSSVPLTDLTRPLVLSPVPPVPTSHSPLPSYRELHREQHKGDARHSGRPDGGSCAPGPGPAPVAGLDRQPQRLRRRQNILHRRGAPPEQPCWPPDSDILPGKEAPLPGFEAGDGGDWLTTCPPPQNSLIRQMERLAVHEPYRRGSHGVS